MPLSQVPPPINTTRRKVVLSRTTSGSSSTNTPNSSSCETPTQDQTDMVHQKMVEKMFHRLVKEHSKEKCIKVTRMWGKLLKSTKEYTLDSKGIKIPEFNIKDFETSKPSSKKNSTNNTSIKSSNENQKEEHEEQEKQEEDEEWLTLMNDEEEEEVYGLGPELFTSDTMIALYDGKTKKRTDKKKKFRLNLSNIVLETVDPKTGKVRVDYIAKGEFVESATNATEAQTSTEKQNSLLNQFADCPFI